MQSNQVGFESSFQQHLDAEQRRAVLEAIGASISPDSTLGEILDAAEALGWSEKMGDFSLADLAEALLAPEGDGASATLAVAEDLDEDELEDEVDDLDDDELEDLDDLDDDDDLDDELDDEIDDEEFEVVIQESSAKRGKKAAAKKATAKKAAAKKVSKKATAKKATAKKATAKKATAKKATAKTVSKAPAVAAVAKKAAKKTSKKAAASQAAAPASSKKGAKRKLTAVDVDDRMSLDQAAEFFLPYVEELGEATMQALEEQTSVSRRKLRFHVGQLVKHGLLERHGMGRGTYYTKV